MFKTEKFSPKTQREQRWHQIINDWLSSGKRILIYCREKKIATASFYQWRNRLIPDYPKRSKSISRSKKRPLNNKLFVPIQVNTGDDNVKERMTDEGLTLHYPNGCYLRLKRHFDPEVLGRLNQAMGV